LLAIGAPAQARLFPPEDPPNPATVIPCSDLGGGPGVEVGNRGAVNINCTGLLGQPQGDGAVVLHVECPVDKGGNFVLTPSGHLGNHCGSVF